MKYDFWKDIKVGDILYYYDDDSWKISYFTILNINREFHNDGSFIIETDYNKHKFIYVSVAGYFTTGIINTWDHRNCQCVYINDNKQELIDDCKEKLKEKIKSLKYDIEYYQDLLNKV